MERTSFTDEHHMFREAFRTFVEREMVPHRERWEEAGIVDRELFAKAGASGFLAMAVPEEHGGAGVKDFRYNQIVAEEICAADVYPAGLGMTLHSDVCLPYFLDYCNDEQKKRWLPGIASGELITAIGMTEPGIGSDLASMSTTAIRDGDEYVINGSKTFITNGHRADVIVLVTKTGDAGNYDDFTLFLVPMDSPGVIREKKLEKLGMHASDTALLAFQDVRVPASAMLGEEGKGFYHIMWELQGERLIGAAGCVAGAQRCFDRTLEYALERTAFGRPIGKFQAIRHKFADMATKIEAGRQMVYSTAWRFANGEYPVREISMAKLFTAQMACEVTDECLQIHGGAGYMREYGIERAWRDMRLNRIGAGTDEIMLDVIGRSYGL